MLDDMQGCRPLLAPAHLVSPLLKGPVLFIPGASTTKQILSN